jgi:Protein of unknown function (DUF664)
MLRMTWTAPQVQRADPPEVAGERQSLENWLDYHRTTLLLKCQGLTGEQLVTPAAAPSTLTLLGLVRHMAENERWWFRREFARQPGVGDLYVTAESPDGELDLADPAQAEADLATYATECALAREATAGRSLDEEFLELRGNTPMDLRWVFQHMSEEYARHNGHADIIRESIDGVTGE